MAVRVGKIAIGVGIGLEGIQKSLATLQPGAALAAGALLISLGSAAKAALSRSASGAGSSSAGISGGFGERSIFENANQGGSAARPGEAGQEREIRVVLETSVTPSGDIQYSAKEGERRLNRQGTDLK